MKFSIATILTVLASGAMAAPTQERNLAKRQVEGVLNPVKSLGKVPGLEKVADLGQPSNQDANGNSQDTNTSDPEALAAANRALEEELTLEKMVNPNSAGQAAPPANEREADFVPPKEDVQVASPTTTAAAAEKTAAPTATQTPAAAPAKKPSQKSAAGNPLGGVTSALSILQSLGGLGLPIKK